MRFQGATLSEPIAGCSIKSRSQTPPLTNCANGRAWQIDLSADKIQHANRLRKQFRRYYPQMLQLGSDLADEWIFALWE